MHTHVKCAAIAAIALVALSACSSSATSEGSDSQADTTALKAAQDAVAKATVAPTSLGLSEALSSKPEGKKIYEIEFPGPVGQVVGDSVVSACKELGCEVTRVPMGADPASQTAAWDRAVRDKPDAVVSAGVTTAVVGKQMRQLRDAGVKVAVFISDAKAGTDVDVNLAGPDRMASDGTLQADWIAADSKGEATVVAYDFPDLPYTAPWADAVKSELSKTCPSCKVDAEHYGFAIAKQFPSRVVRYLQQHPETNYVALTYGDEMVGLPQALSAAGLDDKVKIIGRAGTSLNFQIIKDHGPQKADVGFPVQLFSWGLVDASSRLLAGQDPATPYAKLTQILTPETITFEPKSTPSWTGVEDFKDQFAKSWGTSS
jgi:ribose transport system substrate-binding protein